jgi:hypothetical protein
MGGQNVEQLWKHRREVVNSAPWDSRAAFKPSGNIKEARLVGVPSPSFLGQGCSETALASAAEEAPVRNLRRPPAWMHDETALREAAAEAYERLLEDQEWVDHANRGGG